MRFGADFTALIDRFSSSPSQPLAVAVSGGGDSLALLHLLHVWACEAERNLIAFTVDHGLRSASRGEAETVARLCEAWRIPHQILTWDMPKPAQNAAREARYQLLSTAMRQAGAAILLTGHTFDDVVETVFMRRRRGVRDALATGPTPAAPLPVWPDGRGQTLIRPLVRVTRSRLRTYLSTHKVDWMEDPSNQNANYERVRIRQSLARHQTLRELTGSAVSRLQAARLREDVTLAQAFSRINVRSDGLIETHAAPKPARLLSLLARVASGGMRDPRGSAIAALKKSLTAPGERQTVGGAWFQRTPTGYLIGRDPAGVATECIGDVFDGRYVRDAKARLPQPNEAAFLVRHALPPGTTWRQIISERLLHMQACLYAPSLELLRE